MCGPRQRGGEKTRIDSVPDTLKASFVERKETEFWNTHKMGFQNMGVTFHIWKHDCRLVAVYRSLMFYSVNKCKGVE